MKKAKLKKTFIAFVSLIVLSGLMAANCFAYTGFTNTPLRGQETDYWCWAASDQMLLETQGLYRTQTTIAGGINRIASAGEAYDRLEACSSGIQWDLYWQCLSWDQVKNTINSGWAIWMGLARPTGGGHAMVITGYDQNPGGYCNIWMQDPWGDDNTAPHDGEEGWCNYAAPVYGDYTNSIFLQCQNLYWRETIC